MPTEQEKLLRDRAIIEAAKLDNNTSPIDAVMHIVEKLMRCGLQHCKFDPEWKKLFRTLLGEMEEVSLLSRRDIDKLVRYHHLLWKTGEGWTYARSLREMNISNAYHPKILIALKDSMSSTTLMANERLDEFNEEVMEGEAAALIGSAEDWKIVGILQFFAETDRQVERIQGPTSQKTKPVYVKDGNNWAWRPATEATDALHEPRWPGTLVEEDFARTNDMKALFESRPDDLHMCFAQFLCQYQHIKRSSAQYQRLQKALERSADNMGPKCEKTLIAGTLDMAPKFMMLKNDEIVSMSGKRDTIIRLAAQEQVLSEKTKVFLFGQWRRPEKALLDEEVAKSDIGQCDRVRLQLFPSSAHISE